MEESKNPIQVADRLFDTLEVLANDGPLALNELTSLLGLNKSTLHRILSSLTYMGYVKQNDETQKYDLTLKLLTVSNHLLSRMDILEEVKPYLKKICHETGETVHFVQLDGNEAVYIHKEESSQTSYRMFSRVGSRIPVYCSGVGKAMAADMDTEHVRKIWDSSDIRQITEKTIIDYNKFLKKLQEIREKGYSLDDEENELGVKCIAISLPNYRGDSKYAISISAPIGRMKDDRIEELSKILLETKEKLMNNL